MHLRPESIAPDIQTAHHKDNTSHISAPSILRKATLEQLKSRTPPMPVLTFY